MRSDILNELALEVSNNFVDSLNSGIKGHVATILEYAGKYPGQELVITRLPQFFSHKSSLNEVELAFVVSYSEHKKLFSVGNSNYYVEDLCGKINTELILHLPVFAREGVEEASMRSRLSAVVGELATALRHELEHSRQHEEVSRDQQITLAEAHAHLMSDYERFDPASEDLYNSYLKYFANDAELGAYTSQFRFQHTVLNGELGTIIENFIFEKSSLLVTEYNERENSEGGIRHSITNFIKTRLFGVKQKRLKNFKLALREIIYLHYSSRYFDSYDSAALAKYHDIF